nr:RNA-directed DNA polymerase [Tanacetum cinerariifolium]
MELDVNMLLERCRTCHIAKTHSSNAGKSAFEVMYGRNPITPLDLLLVLEVGKVNEEGDDQSMQIKELYQSVQEQIIQHKENYKEHADKCRKKFLYREGDIFWIHLRKERFSAWRFKKLKPRGDNPFHLSPYKRDSDDESDSGSSLFQEREDDADAVNELVNVIMYTRGRKKGEYSTYDRELYAIVRSLDTWRHYLLSNEFVLFSDHEALKFIKGQHKLKSRHPKLLEGCRSCHIAKNHSSNASLYTPLSVPVAPWEDVS